MPVAIVEAATAAEALGYEELWANDKVINPAAAVRGTVEAAQVIEPFIVLASLIHLVPRIRLGTSVLVLPQRNAVLVAKQAAALDLLSGHRFTLGVGIGWRTDEFALLGADFGNRGAMTDEAIEVLQALWREPIVNFHGQFHDFDAVRLPPHPSDGGPPIWIGGNGPDAIRRAARYGRGWLPFNLDLEAFRSGVTLLRDLTRERRCPTIANLLYFRIKLPDEPATVRSTIPWMAPPIAGSTDAIAQHLDAYRREGLEYALCGFESEDLDDLLRQMRLFAEQIAPQFADAG
jgi:probable F420-dependent oxidoreductase